MVNYQVVIDPQYIYIICIYIYIFIANGLSEHPSQWSCSMKMWV